MLVGGVVQVEVEGGHAPLDVDMPDDQRLAVLLDDRGGHLVQLLHDLVRETLAGEGQVGKLLGIGHAPGAVGALHQAVLGLHLFPGHVLGRREPVLDDLEHEIVGRHGEHAHHHALDTGGDDELVGGALHMAVGAAVVVGLAVLVVAHGAVYLGNGLGGHQLLQEQHILRGDAGIHQEIGAGKTEQHADLVRAKQHGVDEHPAGFVVQDGQHKRHGALAGDDTADDVGALVAIKMVLQHLHLDIAAAQVKARREVALNHLDDIGDIPGGVFVGDIEGVIVQQAGHQFLKGISQAVGPVNAADVGGGHVPVGREHENVIVADLAVLGYRAVHRVEEGLGYLEIVVTLDEAGVNLPGATPEFIVVQLLAGNQLHVLDDPPDVGLVHVYTLARGALDTVPIRVLEPGLRRQGNVLELGEIGLEAVQDSPGKPLFSLHLAPRAPSVVSCSFSSYRRIAGAACACRPASDRSPQLYAAGTR